ncbi:hypothetical protein FNJ84_17250 [Paracoccus sp. M683]|uniref:hypothetical protein n=1 Tax=Paracoccus sp. M683 TaxID=2594268 RepID=UPI0011803714|nr:hypothetical protein [Paracoccus sp. M683]TRW95036.1 hypothetical protein FNJ84_17250 [Paracoccus sp. M683]
MTQIFDCLGQGWTPVIGDPTIFGWLTVISYLICAVLAAMVWNSRHERTLRRFWAIVMVLMLALALNKQLDLQTAFTATARCWFETMGWYDVRRFAQLVFIIVLIAAVFLLYRRGTILMRRHRRTHGLALLGLGIVAAYVVIRASSFHLVDLLGSKSVMGISMNFLLENIGLLLIAINAIGLLSGRIRPGERRAAAAARQSASVAAGAARVAGGQRPLAGGVPQQTPGPEGGKSTQATKPPPGFPLEPRGH